jgi:hypothetical protein
VKLAPVALAVILAGLGLVAYGVMSDPLIHFAVGLSVASFTSPHAPATVGEYVDADRSATPRSILDKLYKGTPFAVMELKQVYVLPAGEPYWAARVTDTHGTVILLLQYRRGYAPTPGTNGGWYVQRYPDQG